jgi:hypothetical protein
MPSSSRDISLERGVHWHKKARRNRRGRRRICGLCSKGLFYDDRADCEEIRHSSSETGMISLNVKG